VTPAPEAPTATSRLPEGKLPFVGLRRDGQLGYWVMPAEVDDTDKRLTGRTYAAWFLLYAELNGQKAGRQLMDRIEREMPSRHPQIDRTFLEEIGRAGFQLAA
jgi:hypothetical protein